MLFRPLPRTFLLFVLTSRLAIAGDASAAVTVSSAGATDLAQRARSVSRGESIRIEGARLDGRADVAGFDLVRFDAVAAGARLVAQTSAGPRILRPEMPVYLRGSVDGMTGSVAVFSVRASGDLRGVVSSSEGTWMVERKAGATDGLRSHRVDRQALAASRSFRCEVLDNPTPRRTAGPSSPGSASPRLPIAYTAQVAVELDYDYYQTFAPDADSAVLYALDMMAFIGSLGESELGMNVQVPFVQIWTTPSDPYSSGSARLGQVKDRWNTAGATNCGGSDCTTIARSTVILLSSASTGGVAYLPGLCDSWHSPTNGYAYAYTGSIGGDFDIGNPTSVWDIVATAHELGHNFGSTHTHCFSPPIDECYGSEDGCYAGPESLPSGCPGSGQGCGTIMSYCHLLSGGMSNVALSYGAGHPYGDATDRVPNAMMSQIATEASTAPGCLSATDGMVQLTVAKAGSGSGVITSSPAGINCGGACRTWLDADASITLVATPGPFSTFAGWSGDADCSDGSVTLSSATSCTATFEGNCGASNADCDDANPCTVDSCVAADHCLNASTPRDPAGCYAAGKSRLKIADAADASDDKMSWQWSAGEAFVQADLGDPTLTTDYTVCVYDTTGGASRLATTLSLPAGGSFWRSSAPRGWTWSDNGASLDGIKKLQIKTGAAGKTKVKLAGAGSLLPLPAPFSAGEYFDLSPSVVVQMVTSDNRCWSSSFEAATANTPVSFKAAGN